MHVIEKIHRQDEYCLGSAQEYSQSKVKSIVYQSLRKIGSSVKSLSGVGNVGMTAAASWEVREEGDESSPLIYEIISF